MNPYQLRKNEIGAHADYSKKNSKSLHRNHSNLSYDLRRLLGARIELLETEIEVLEKTGETTVTSLLVQTGELEKIIELNIQLIELEEERAVEEARLYNEGRNILTNLIQSRDSVQAQKEKLVDNFARYHYLVIQYRALIDQLLEE